MKFLISLSFIFLFLLSASAAYAFDDYDSNSFCKPRWESDGKCYQPKEGFANTCLGINNVVPLLGMKRIDPKYCPAKTCPAGEFMGTEGDCIKPNNCAPYLGADGKCYRPTNVAIFGGCTAAQIAGWNIPGFGPIELDPSACEVVAPTPAVPISTARCNKENECWYVEGESCRAEGSGIDGSGRTYKVTIKPNGDCSIEYPSDSSSGATQPATKPVVSTGFNCDDNQCYDTEDQKCIGTGSRSCGINQTRTVKIAPDGKCIFGSCPQPAPPTTTSCKEKMLKNDFDYCLRTRNIPGSTCTGDSKAPNFSDGCTNPSRGTECQNLQLKGDFDYCTRTYGPDASCTGSQGVDNTGCVVNAVALVCKEKMLKNDFDYCSRVYGKESSCVGEEGNSDGCSQPAEPAEPAKPAIPAGGTRTSVSDTTEEGPGCDGVDSVWGVWEKGEDGKFSKLVSVKQRYTNDPNCGFELSQAQQEEIAAGEKGREEAARQAEKPKVTGIKFNGQEYPISTPTTTISKIKVNGSDVDLNLLSLCKQRDPNCSVPGEMKVVLEIFYSNGERKLISLTLRPATGALCGKCGLKGEDCCDPANLCEPGGSGGKGSKCKDGLFCSTGENPTCVDRSGSSANGPDGQKAVCCEDRNADYCINNVNNVPSWAQSLKDQCADQGIKITGSGSTTGSTTGGSGSGRCKRDGSIKCGLSGEDCCDPANLCEPGGSGGEGSKCKEGLFCGNGKCGGGSGSKKELTQPCEVDADCKSNNCPSNPNSAHYHKCT